MANAAVIAACIAGMMICITSCGKKHASAEELVQAENMGRQRAMELKHNVFIDTMFVERTLIDVREREQRLRNEGADDLADRYHRYKRIPPCIMDFHGTGRFLFVMDTGVIWWR